MDRLTVLMGVAFIMFGGVMYLVPNMLTPAREWKFSDPASGFAMVCSAGFALLGCGLIVGEMLF